MMVPHVPIFLKNFLFEFSNLTWRYMPEFEFLIYIKHPSRGRIEEVVSLANNLHWRVHQLPRLPHQTIHQSPLLSQPVKYGFLHPFNETALSLPSCGHPCSQPAAESYLDQTKKNWIEGKLK
jgi:hypothetical protein